MQYKGIHGQLELVKIFGAHVKIILFKANFIKHKTLNIISISVLQNNCVFVVFFTKSYLFGFQIYIYVGVSQMDAYCFTQQFCYWLHKVYQATQIRSGTLITAVSLKLYKDDA